MQEFLHDQSDCRILRHHVNRPRFLVRIEKPGRSAVFLLCRAALEKRHCRTGEQSLSLVLQPHSLSVYSSPVAEFRVTVSVCRRSKFGVTELSVTTAWKRLSWTETAFEAATGLYLPRLWPPAETQSLYTRLSQSGSSLVSDRFWHWQNYLTLDLTIDIQ